MKISEAKRKSVIEKFKHCRDVQTVAQELKLSPKTVENILNDADTSLKRGTISEFMEEKNAEICDIIDTYLSVLSDSERIAAAPLNQIASALGTVIDKFTKNANANADNGKLEKLIAALKK